MVYSIYQVFVWFHEDLNTEIDSNSLVAMVMTEKIKYIIVLFLVWKIPYDDY